MRKKIIACMIVLAVAVAFMPVMSFAASKTVKMTSYEQVIKSGNTAYCAGARGLYKVTLKKGKVKKVKILYSTGRTWFEGSQLSAMKKKGNYIYFVLVSGIDCQLYRIKTSGKKRKLLATGYDSFVDYAIKGKKIYYGCCTDDWDENYVTRVMKLNGKSKKRTSVTPVLKIKNSNKSGYKMIYRTKGSYVQDFLKTPKGKFYLGRVYLEGWDDEEDF